MDFVAAIDQTRPPRRSADAPRTDCTRAPFISQSCLKSHERHLEALRGVLPRPGGLSAQLLDVGVHEHLDELVEAHLGLPAEPLPNLRRVANERRRIARAA